MAHASTKQKKRTLARRWAAAPALLMLSVLGASSCVPMVEATARSNVAAPAQAAAPVLPPAAVAALAPAEAPVLVGTSAETANAALPAANAGPAATAYVFQARSGVDQLRALDCLTQAVYYEAGNQSEDGQRAVAQVVLNRVRHPAFPHSVCGVVYQGPAIAGGGCQFTFTCDGSLARHPAAALWEQARRIASEALAGRTFAPVGLATFYHANYVFPAWAPRLVKVATIGAHIFYRLPGQWGQSGTFGAPYTGNEPFPHPTYSLAAARRSSALPATVLASSDDLPALGGSSRVALASSPAAAQAAVVRAQEEAQIRPEFRGSGQWRDDAPAALTGH